LREGVKGKMKNHCRNGVQLCGKPESKRAKQTTWILKESPKYRRSRVKRRPILHC